MNAPEPPVIPNVSEEVASAMEWWRDAGVDYDFSDDVTAWLSSPPAEQEQTASQNAAATRQPGTAQRAAKPESSAIPETLRIDFFAGNKPQTLDEFREFWLTAVGLDAIGPRGRVAPRGQAGADLMVLVVDPEEGDQGTLLSGPLGQLLGNILSAMGSPPEKVYFASALPRHTPMADTASLAASGLDEVVRHHISLAKPQKIIAFGARLTPFIAESLTQPEKSLRKNNYSAALPPILATEGLESLMETPPLKARFWRRWMEWSADK